MFTIVGLRLCFAVVVYDRCFEIVFDCVCGRCVWKLCLRSFFEIALVSVKMEIFRSKKSKKKKHNEEHMNTIQSQHITILYIYTYPLFFLWRSGERERERSKNVDVSTFFRVKTYVVSSSPSEKSIHIKIIIL